MFANIFENIEKTVVLVAIDSKSAGIIALADTTKLCAIQAIDSLKSIGKNLVLLTGDNEKTEKFIVSILGINRIMAQVLPQLKEHVISKLMTGKNSGYGRGRI